MKILLVFILALVTVSLIHNDSFAEKSTFFESVKFVQYLDENTALEEVRNGNLDIYYYRISSDRLENQKSREGLEVFDSTGGSYSILVNPAESNEFNPFSIKDVRFALNYLIDRKLIVSELLGGYGAPMISYYSPSDPEYLTIIKQLETFNFRYNPILAEEMISNALKEKGAIKSNNQWKINDEPIKITIFIRSDDPVRKSIGEILSSELGKLGFVVKKEYGDLNKAFVVVYGSDPAELKWNLYTEGWTRSAFVKYDSVGLAQMYSPWFSNMPGFNDPSYWNYKNEQLDAITQKIYTGDFESEEQRAELIQNAIAEGIDQSVRIFLASKIDQYVANEKMEGIINDLGAGVPSRFTPINSRNDEKELVIGIKQINQGAWNPVMGLGDTYSRQIWGIISDSITFKHPFTGKTFPIRADWNIETAGPDGKLNLPNDAIMWDPVEQQWKKVMPGTQAISKVRFDFKFSNWHNGQRMDMNDILHSLYFTMEWGTQTDENDKTFDVEFTPIASQTVQTIIGIEPIDEDTIDVYVNYWHFDEGEIADWAALWSSMPWEISAAMEQAVIDGKVSFSRSGATNKNVNWISLIIPNDAQIIQNYLNEFDEKKYIPKSLESFKTDFDYFDNRYAASSKWIKEKNHAVISNGPFYLSAYSPESRTIIVNAFDDETYPFKLGHWSEFEKTEFPKITKMNIPEIMQKGTDWELNIETSEADSILYFIIDSRGNSTLTELINIDENPTRIKIPGEKTENFNTGAVDLKIFAISNSVLKPDYYSTSFLVMEDKEALPEIKQSNIEFNKENSFELIWIVVPIVVVIVTTAYIKKRKQRNYLSDKP
ncbi:MAG TPA: ABC transporter substrate-binding protein [Nitrosarchaeum sp.]|nr:ABC transporter substrate-binding protein [Nitrosarchaeum sp.]